MWLGMRLELTAMHLNLSLAPVLISLMPLVLALLPQPGLDASLEQSVGIAAGLRLSGVGYLYLPLSFGTHVALRTTCASSFVYSMTVKLTLDSSWNHVSMVMISLVVLGTGMLDPKCSLFPVIAVPSVDLVLLLMRANTRE
jgi:hypothetical protein